MARASSITGDAPPQRSLSSQRTGEVSITQGMFSTGGARGRRLEDPVVL